MYTYIIGVDIYRANGAEKPALGFCYVYKK